MINFQQTVPQILKIQVRLFRPRYTGFNHSKALTRPCMLKLFSFSRDSSLFRFSFRLFLKRFHGMNFFGNHLPAKVYQNRHNQFEYSKTLTLNKRNDLRTFVIVGLFTHPNHLQPGMYILNSCEKKFHMINESIFIDKLRDLVILIKKKRNRTTNDVNIFGKELIYNKNTKIVDCFYILFLLLLSNSKIFLYQPCRMCRCTN